MKHMVLALLVMSSFAAAEAVSSRHMPEGWNMMSIPLDPADPDPEVVFSDLKDAGNVISSNLFRFDPYDGYQMYDYDFDTVETGRGYWLRVTYEATAGMEGAPESEPVSIPLVYGWNLIGHPLPYDVPWTGCSITYDEGGPNEETKTIQEAVAAHWILGTVYYYVPGQGHKTLAYAPGDDEMLRPWYGYWIFSREDDLTLKVFKRMRSKVVFTVGSDLDDWTLTVGLHADATDGFDNSYDSFAPPPSPAVEMRMVSYIEGDREGYAMLDMRDGTGTGGVAESWDYVDVLVPGAGPTEQHDVVLTWDLTQAGDYDYTLYDTTNAETVDLQTESSYELTTTGRFGAMMVLEARPRP